MKLDGTDKKTRVVRRTKWHPTREIAVLKITLDLTKEGELRDGLLTFTPFEIL